ncbi:hypothetical protein HDV01_002346 [Terramyces sp. JEL0728]|nr:hypothetical protein HDV01_002346 [Terramyces sp. JEL0728]
MEKVISVTRKYYNQLLLKVHPDYFANNPLVRRMNEKSVQELNLILSNIASSNLDKLSPTEIHLATKSTQKSLKLDPYRHFTPLSLRNHKKRNKVLMKSWTGEIIKLCQEFGIKIAENDLDMWSDDPKPESKEKERFEDELKSIIMDRQCQSYRLPMVIYAKGLSVQQKSIAANKLVKFLNGLPWLVEYEFRAARGIFVVPWDFNDKLLQNYIQSNFERVSREFTEV